MTNHVHLVVVPQREDSLAVLLRRVHGRYAQYYNVKTGRSGHLWQNRYFACGLGRDHLWAAIAYVERNPSRAGLVSHPGEYAWSSAAAHLTGADPSGTLDIDWWHGQNAADWACVLGAEDPGTEAPLRRCTYSGRPFGSEDFVTELSRRFGRHWVRGRPPKERTKPTDQRSSVAGG